jgi:hypothetical protein
MDVLRLNHYWARSIEGLGEKARRGDVWTGAAEANLAWRLKADAQCNQVEDRMILTDLERMKREPPCFVPTKSLYNYDWLE